MFSFVCSINFASRCIAEDTTLKPESGCSGPFFTLNRTECNRAPHETRYNPKLSPTSVASAARGLDRPRRQKHRPERLRRSLG